MSNEKYISRLFLCWALAFIIKAILSYFLMQYTFDNLKDSYLNEVILIVVINFVTDIAPCISVLEVKFIELFKMTKRRERSDTMDTEAPMIFDEDED